MAILPFEEMETSAFHRSVEGRIIAEQAGVEREISTDFVPAFVPTSANLTALKGVGAGPKPRFRP